MLFERTSFSFSTHLFQWLLEENGTSATFAAEGHIVASRCLCELKDKLCARGIAEGITRPEGLVG